MSSPTEELIAAIAESSMAGVTRALALGADPNSATDGTPILHCAVELGQTDIVRALLAAGADANAMDDQGWTALHWAVDASIEESKCAYDDRGDVSPPRLDIVRLLLSHGADPTKRDAKGTSCVELAESSPTPARSRCFSYRRAVSHDVAPSDAPQPIPPPGS